MLRRLTIAVMTEGLLASQPAIAGGPRRVATALEVHGQLGGDLARSVAVAPLETLAGLQVQARARADRDTRVEHLLVERANERVALRHGAVRRPHLAHDPKELSAAGEGRTAELGVARVDTGSGGERGRELDTGHAGRDQHLLLVRGEAVQLRLDELPKGLGRAC